ncbi:MAG: glycosyltransferase family 4 protein [Candidatus Komeilibacteria bacterium]|jgi:glycosyltransferase involved in cell wall biosynthesis|nr:glycosyltransferase family 4 protein [Candidatus Komeilibacteria bacterium]
MNIGIDIRALGNKKLTGIGKYIYHAITHLLELDKENNYYLFSSGLKEDPYTELDFNQPNVKHFHLSVPNKLLNLNLITGINSNICQKFFKDIDLFWMPNINFCNLPKNFPMILTVHDLSFLHSREFYSLKRRYWHKLVNVENLVTQADKIIAVSGNTKRDLMRFFPLNEDKISIINPGIDSIPMNEVRAKELLSDFDLPDKFFIYLGTLEPRKNIDSVIKAFDRYHLEYPDVHLVVVGAKGWVYRKLLQKIKKRPFIHYLNYVESPAKDALYYMSQGLIWPSFYEGFGFPPMEAISYKTPVIVSYKTSLPETNKQQALYVDPYNISDIYKALKFLTEDKELIKQLKASAKTFKVPQWENQAQQILDLFNSYHPRGDHPVGDKKFE